MQIIQNFPIDGKHHKPIVADVFYIDNHQPKPIIIFCHGYKGFKDWGAWNLMAEAFVKAGYFFIKFNFSYNGGTLENPIDFPDLEAFGNNNYTKELDDLQSVIDWIYNSKNYQQQIDNSNITLIGHSRGGGISLLKTAEEKRITKVITLASVCDFAKRTATIGDLENWKKEGVKYVLNGRTKQQMPHYYQFYEDFLANKTRLNIKNAVEKISIPLLILHGDKDTSVFIKEAENLKSWNKNAQFIVVKDADHVFNVQHPWIEKKLSKQMREVIENCLLFLE
ncbi:MAG: alpha/beta fold hydrolase [Polaribacter sp.]|nr:alpha/beta fold hydrolase [Polaribacter sp.]